MSRYSTTNIIQTESEKRRFASTIIPVFPLRSDDIFIKTTSVERLDKLAYSFYQDAGLWWIIAASNNLRRGSLMIPANTALRIPSKASYQQIVNNANIR